MSRNRQDSELLADILEAMRRIFSYTNGMTEQVYFEDYKTQDAVVRNLEIIGEATKHLSIEVKEKYSEIAWKEIAAIRDKLIHHYFGIDQSIVWQVIKDDLPSIVFPIERILAEIGK